MANFAKNLEVATKEELQSWVNQLDFRVVPLASDELTRRSVNELQETIKIFNEQSSKQTEKLVKLNWWIVGLTVAMLVGLVVQIILSL